MTVVSELFGSRQRAKLGEFAGLVNGAVPQHETGGLVVAYALFRGLRRPLNTQESDSSTYAYITDPPYSFCYDDQFGAPAPSQKPRNSVFVTYANVFEQQQEADAHFEGTRFAADHPRGEVLWWEWTLAEVPPSGDHRLPKNHGRRYLKRGWV